MWGEIKKSLNSTVGTGKFEPLDKIVSEEKFKNIALVYSYGEDYILHSFFEEQINSPNNQDVFLEKKIRMKIGGTLGVAGLGSNFNLIVQKNGIEYGRGTSLFVEFEKGDELSFGYEIYNSGYIYNMRIYAKVVDYSAMEIEEREE